MWKKKKKKKKKKKRRGANKHGLIVLQSLTLLHFPHLEISYIQDPICRDERNR